VICVVFFGTKCQTQHAGYVTLLATNTAPPSATVEDSGMTNATRWEHPVGSGGCTTHVVAVRQSLAGDASGPFVFVHAPLPLHPGAETSSDRCAGRPQPETGRPSVRPAISIIFLIIGELAHHLIVALVLWRLPPPLHRRHARRCCTDRPVPTTPTRAPALSVKCRRVPLDRAVRSPGRCGAVDN